jgi:hypothetical protein
LSLYPLGSIQDRVQREMVFRERQEKVAYLNAFSKMVSVMFNLDTDRVFGTIRREYTMEVFQEMYDASLLEEKVNALRHAQGAIAARKRERTSLMDRVSRMSEVKVGTFGSAYEESPPKKPGK